MLSSSIKIRERILNSTDENLKASYSDWVQKKEKLTTVLSMSTSLVAVFIPILLFPGIVGRLFREFAVTLTVAIAVSMVVSLTTTPMMCAVLLKPKSAQQLAASSRWQRLRAWFARASQRLNRAMSRGYRKSLAFALRWQWITLAILAGVVTVMAFAPVFRGLDFFASTSDVHGGRFFLPSDAVFALGALTHLPLRPLAYVAVGVAPLVTTVALFRYLRDGGSARLTEASAAIMLSMLLAGSSHAWPWYVLWYLAFAATIPSSGYGRWAMGMALAMPYPLLAWTIWPYASELKKFFLHRSWLTGSPAFLASFSANSATSSSRKWRRMRSGRSG